MLDSENSSFKNRVFYGLGVIGPTVFDTFIGSFLTLYATDILGINALFFASLLLGPKIVDVLIDIFIMYFVGKTRTRFGMYRPWLLNMVGMVLATVTIFSASYFRASETVTLTIVVVAYFLTESIFSSFYWIPYIAMPGAMTEDPNELVKISSSKSIFEYTSSMLVTAATMPILLIFGYHNPKGWSVAALTFGLIGLVSSLLCFAFVRTDLTLEQRVTREYSARDIVHDYKTVITDKGFLVMAALLVLMNLASYTTSSVLYYFYIYNLNIENLIGYLAPFGVAAALVTSLVAHPLQRKFGFKKSLLIGTVCLAAASVSMMLTFSFAMMVVTGCLLVSSTILLTTLIFSLWPKVAKNLNTEKVKTPLNSTVGLSNLFMDFAIIFGNTLGAGIITMSKYDPELAVQNPFTLNVIRYCPPLFTLLLSALMMVLIFTKYGTVWKTNGTLSWE